jgi:signal transduction histidine kinase/ActR/RegA family two-component response regulator
MGQADTIRQFAALASAPVRLDAARELAALLGVEELTVLVRDRAVDHFIPAPGFTPTIRGGPSWRRFVGSLQVPGRHTARVEMPCGHERDALALVVGGIALVLLGGRPVAHSLDEIDPLLPLLACALEAEQRARFAEGQAAEARTAAGRAHALAAALDGARAEGAKLNAELREEHARRDDFLAMLAHELRNPLSPLATSVELLRTRTADEQSTRALDIMARQTRQLSRLVEDLLDVSRVRRGRIDLRRAPLSLSQLLADALEASRPLLEARRHEVVVEEARDPLHVHADAVRIAQIFSNLLHNAAKYTDPGGRIEVAAWRTADDAIVRIRDSGIGISAEVLPRIFDLFTQAPVSLDRAQGGLGIGLTLVRALVELHGGDITAESAGLGQGSTFTLRLPLCTAPAAAAETPSTQPTVAAPGRGLRVLIVEDNEDAAESLAEVTRHFGHDVAVAHSGVMALQVAADLDLHLILLDIGLPGMDGYEVARRLRRSVKRDVILVAITGYGSEEDKRRSREAGFDDHVVKPVMPDALQRVLERACRARTEASTHSLEAGA